MTIVPFRHQTLTPPKILSLGFILLIAAGTILLSLPAASTGVRISIIDALFMATSATCVTGLAVLSASAVVILGGAIVFFGLELNNALRPLHPGGKMMASFLQAITPRSGGVTTIEIPLLRESTQFLMVLLMFIGAAPGSTGGGIKITTFAILVSTVYAKIRDKEGIVIFRHRLSKENVYRAITLSLLSLMLVVAATMLLSVTESADFLSVLFEAVSAFGTSGITMGLTPELTTIGKLLVIVLMFAGRTGPLTLAYALKPKNSKELYRYPEGNITIG
ncbi:potassium transporter TrkG [Paenibacillus sp. P32E]|uniref:potassium transporter TrkG n=1 Tax=Paenibacillus sp. P32E TaxID=1349434 RepID=UPI0009389099|nr:potassium transporter TrkG [Paenibacillus sp. P32E]OKP92375.1 hypothetical protein A3848_07870 [Paenibacillus sp. P32E]